MKTCFLISPLGEPGSTARKEADKLLEHIVQPVCEKLGFEVKRADKYRGSDRITDTILNALINSDLVISDVTGKNANVFYETGFRYALGKPIIHLRATGEMLPFDIANVRAVTYTFDVSEVSAVQKELADTIEAISFETNENPEKAATEQKVLQALSNIMEEITTIKDNLIDSSNAFKSLDASQISYSFPNLNT